jgi:hypothetical protein
VRARLKATNPGIRHYGPEGECFKLLHVFKYGHVFKLRPDTPVVTDTTYSFDRCPALKIRALAKDKGVAAVVLRVDSPGGDALASDLMWREIKQLGLKKPVIACMGAWHWPQLPV